MNDNGSNISSDEDVRMLTAAEVADRLRISVRGVWRQVSNKHMPEPIYIGLLNRNLNEELRRLSAFLGELLLSNWRR